MIFLEKVRRRSPDDFLGEYIWPDGRKYKGEWKDNRIHGWGVFTWSDGRKYTGNYVNDKKHGFGIFQW